MSVIYVKEQGAAVHKRGSRLLVEKDDKTLAEIPLRETELVAVFGNVQVSSQALAELTERGIPVGLFTRHGRLKARVVPEAQGTVTLKLAQYKAAADPTAALVIAKVLVSAKLANSAALADSYRAHYPSESLAAATASLKQAAERAFSAAGIDELMGYEGAGAAAYFRAVGEMNRSEFLFERRQMHPAPDPVNALLSLGYTMAMNEIRGLAECLSLEPHIGFLHAAEDNRPSLALDLLEPFRASIVDRLTLTLINQRILSGEDFVRRVGGGVILQSGGAWERYLRAYEDAMQTPLAHAPRGMRGEMERQVSRLAAALRNGTEFIPFLENVECDT